MKRASRVYEWFWVGLIVLVVPVLALTWGQQVPSGVGRDAMVLLLLAAGALGYFFPAIIASHRHHPNVSAIFALNLLVGWTALGWIISLVWSLTAVKEGAR